MRSQLLIAGLLLASQMAVAGGVAYREIFPNSTGETLRPDTNWDNYGTPSFGSFDGYGWYQFYSSGSGNMNPGWGGIRSAAGNPTDLAPVNSGPAVSDLVNGYNYISIKQVWSRMTFQNEYSISASSLGTVEWWQLNCLDTGGGATNDKFRVLVGTDDGNWYVSSQTFTSVARSTDGGGFSEFATKAEHMVFDFKAASSSASNWYSFDYESGLMMGGTWEGGSRPTMAPTGTITTIGLYDEVCGGNALFDTFTMTQVPEPTALSLLGLGAVALVGRRR